MNPAHLDTLLAILDEGSFEGAAYSLGISPSAVSQRIKALEHSTGRVLIRRVTPPEPTEAGEVIAQMARKMALIQTEAEANLRGKLAQLPLTIAVNADSLETWFRPVLNELAQRGEIIAHIRIEDESVSSHMLRRGDVIGAITRDAEPIAGCVVAPLGTMRYRAVANPAFIQRHTYNGQFDYQTAPAISFGPRDAVQQRAFRQRLGRLPQRDRIHEIPSLEMFIEAARVGLGWAMLLEPQARTLLHSGELQYIDLEVIDVPLYWQRWKVESQALETLTHSVIRAAKQQLLVSSD